MSGKFGSNETTTAVNVYTDELVASNCKLEINGNCLLYHDDRV